MQTVLAVATLIAAVATLVPAFFICWYLAGSDDEPLNPIAPLLGLGVLVGAVAAVVAAARLEREPTGTTLAMMALPVLLFALAVPFAGTKAVGRATGPEAVKALAVLAVTPVLGALARLAG